MKQFKYFFKCAMALAVAGVLPSCGEKDEPLPALVPAYVTVASADQALELLGGASSKSVDVEANRELKVTVPADASWLTATATTPDPTTSKATLSISVTDNTTAFKGRTALIQIECVAAREGDNVSSASAKATIEVKQSLKGLVVADVFDLKLFPDGKAEDGTGNLPVKIGEVPPKVTLDAAYNRYYATFTEIQCKKYATGNPNDFEKSMGWDVNPGDAYWEQYVNGKTYISYDAEGNLNPQGEGDRRLCYYKMPWGSTNFTPPLTTAGQNEKMVAAYESAFSYELVFRVGEFGFSDNIFGNLNPTHCGFGIKSGNGSKINFQYFTMFGTSYHMDDSSREGTEGSEAGAPVEQGVWYHVVVTYNRNATVGSGKVLVMYVDGKEITYVYNTDELKTHGLKFPTDYYASSNGQHTHDRRTPNTEYLCIGGGSHQSGRPTFGVKEGTQVMIARVYGKALTAAEVTASYNALTPE